jgi:CHAT domain-containing protein/tetratricopeptide (TPR) repeat protein
MSGGIAIAESGPHELTVEAPTDLPVLITISGRAVDVRAAVVTDDSRTAVFADAPNRRMGVETLFIDAPHQPIIDLKIERNDHSEARGHADIVAVALPIKKESDRRRLEAARLDAAGCLAFSDLAKGIESAEAFDAAAQLHGRNGDRPREGLARLHAAGARYARLADWAGASDRAPRAAAALAGTDMPELVAFARRVEGAALDQRANAGGIEPAARERYLRLARERLTDAYELFQMLGNSYEAGYALNYRGVSYDVAGDRERAREDFLEALSLFRKAGDHPAQALSLQSLALQSHQDGRLSDAMREFDEALALIPREEDQENYAHTLHNSAWPFRAVGRFDEAIARFHEAGEILRKRGNRDGEARALHGLGTTLMYAGEPQRAAELLEAAIRLRGETGARREQALSLFALGEVEREAGRIDRAIAHHEKALSLVTAPHDLAQARLVLARAYLAAGRLPQARRELEKILRLDLPPSYRYLGLALAELGGIESLAGRSEVSLEYFSRAIKILDANGSDLEHARTLVRRAETQLRTGNTKGSIADTKDALARLEDIGLQSLQAESRAAFRASYRDAIELQIAALLNEAEIFRSVGSNSIAQQSLQAALAASDGGRARLTAETAPIDAGVVPDELLSRRRQLYELLAGKRQQRDRLLNATTPDEDRIAELTREIARLRTEASLVERRVANMHGATHVSASSSLAHNLAQLVPDNTVVAEYFVGRTHSWLFEIRKGQITVHTIGTGAEVEELARHLHVAWRNKDKSSTDRRSTLRRLAPLLFDQLGPIGSDESLHVIPDGPLHLVPMTVLARQALPRVRSGSIHIATALAGTPDHRAGRSPDTDRLIAVVADPIYSADDSRIRGAAAPRPAVLSNVMLTRHARDLAQLRRLPYTAVEADAIASLAGDGMAALALLGADAARLSITEAGLDRYRIVHFATHAFADSQDPALAMLALSRFDRDGNPLNGDLRLFDIAQLRLNAELVVLSACDTAIGREIAGEAPLGLAHAFLRSGAKSVLATLWRVPDTSTARLMEEFYRQLLINRQPPSAALELAQLYIRKQPRWSDPYFWAGFQLISNARFEAGNNNVE